MRKLQIALANLAIAAALVVPSLAHAADPWTGKIGRIDLRTGYADTYLGTTYSQHDIVIRSSSAASGNIVCIVEQGTALFDQVLTTATAAMLAGSNVTIQRHGAAQGQYKCSHLSISN
jgi:hypothetical protein